MKLALLSILFCGTAVAQNVNGQYTVIGSTAQLPATCSPTQTWLLTPGGVLYTCQNGMPAIATGGGGGAGTVTHTVGALNATQIVTGNGGADIQTPSAAATVDGSGNIAGNSVLLGPSPPTSSICTSGGSFLCTPGATSITGTLAAVGVLWWNSGTSRWDMYNTTTLQQIVGTGGDINTSDQVTVTHLASPLPAAQGGTGNTAGAGSTSPNPACTFVATATGCTINVSAIAVPSANSTSILMQCFTSAAGTQTAITSTYTFTTGSGIIQTIVPLFTSAAAGGYCSATLTWR